MENKVAVITGASSGIGRDFAIALLNMGCKVVLAGRREAALQETLAMANSDVDGICIKTDVTNVEEVRNLFEQTKTSFGRLDLLFNNAGIAGPPVMLEDLDFEVWKRVVDTNLNGAFLCTQHAFKIMKEQNPQGGRIINNGSISAHVPRPNSAPYTATKHAITGLTKAAGLDGRKYNIAVGQIDIGNALTSMAKAMTRGVPQADGTIAIEPTMDVTCVTDTLMYMSKLPLNANVPFVTVMATKMPYIGRG